MMALSPLNVTTAVPAASAAPPGGAPAGGAFALLLPIAGPADPRHEPAPDGKSIGKEMPVEERDPANPLVWLIPPAISQQQPTPAGEKTPITPRVSRPVPIAAGESGTPSIAPPASLVPPAMEDRNIALTPLTSANLPQSTIDAPTVLTPAPPSIALVVSSIPSSGDAVEPLIARALSGPVPTIARDAAVVAPPVAPLLPISATPIAPSGNPSSTAIGAEKTVTAPIASSGARSSPTTRTAPKPASDPAIAVPAEIRPATTPAPRIAPAAQVFAQAIHRATRDDRGPATPDAAALVPASDIATHVVAATPDAQHAALDLRQEQWPARMIERIDALRDAANANDASIRLIPDALGKIDVSLKRDGDTVAVNFSAHQPETRQLLSDAAPKLAELAEARGLKLTQDGADTAGRQQPRQQPSTPPAAAPPAVRADDTQSTDTRIA